MKIIKSKRYMRFMSLGDKSRSFIREKPLIPSSIIHNNKTITITIFMASRSCRKRRSINMFQFVKPIQGCLINAGDVLLPIYIYIHRYRSLYSSTTRSNSRKTDDESRSNWSNYIVHVCFSEYPRDKADFSVITRTTPSNGHPWKLINLQVRAPSFVGWCSQFRGNN